MKTTIRCVLASIACTIAFGCSRPDSSGPPKAQTGVTFDTPKKKDLVRVIEQPAWIEPFEETPLVAHIAGYVEKDLADIGQTVKGPQYDASGKVTKPGQVLATLSVPEMLSEYQQKKSLVKQAKAQVDQTLAALEAAESAIVTAKAQVREAESNRARAVANYDYWKGQYARIEENVRDRVLDKQIGEETLNKYKSAQASRQEVEAKVESAQASAKESESKRDKSKADLSAAHARVQVTEAEESRLAALVEYRFLRAPFKGVVTRRFVHTGHYLQPGAGGASNTVFIVARTDLLRIKADIPEAESPFIDIGMKGTIQPPIYKEKTFDGTIARTSWALDNKSRTLRIEIDYENKQEELRPGMYANLIFNVKLEGRWTLPASAIFVHIDQPCCWRDVDGKAARTPVKVGVRVGSDVEILKMQTSPGNWEAVTGNEKIVVTNLGAVSEGKELPKEK